MNKIKIIVRFKSRLGRLHFLWSTFWDWDIPDEMWIEIVRQTFAKRIEVNCESEYSAEYWNQRAKLRGKQ